MEEAYLITETEAYFGFEDKGSHAHRGKTPRNTPMFLEAGTIYVYFTYGMHFMLNLVCGKKEFPAAVLIRGLTFQYSIECWNVVLDGPGKLTKHLQIDKKLNMLPLGKKAGLWVEDRGVIMRPREIKKTPRIGIPGRGVWTTKPWRFVIYSGRTVGTVRSGRVGARGAVVPRARR